MPLIEQHSSSVYLDHHTSEPEVRPFLGGTVGVYTAPCPGDREHNEDACGVIGISPVTGVLVLADGMGGGASGHLASAAAVTQMTATLQSDLTEGTQLRTAILNAFENCNAAVQTIAGSATTLLAIEIHENTIRTYHVGDSAVFVVGGRGKVKYQSISHSPTGYGVEAGLLDESEALHHDERHLVTNIMGTAEMHIEIGPRIVLSARDTVVLASDGLTDNLHVHEIAESARLRPLDRAMAAVVNGAKARMNTADKGLPSKPDDLTVIGYRGG